MHNPRNRFAPLELVHDEPGLEPVVDLRVARDASRTIVSKNDSPDVGFDHSVNPYRGCFHGCSYCYARPTHEFLDLGAGTDFERRLLFKANAAELLKQKLLHPSWQGQLLAFSGITDCYQPLEAEFGLTRACLEVCRDFRNPVGIVTKGTLITRDLALLQELHEVTHLSVHVSIPIWDQERARAVEPYVASPERRMRTLETLAAAGLHVALNVAPFIPGLSEHNLEELIRRAADAGAVSVGTILLRLPGNVARVFEDAIRLRLPLTADKILARIREARGGKLNDPRFGKRMRGEGPYARAVLSMIDRLVKKHLGDRPDRAMPLTPSTFRRPTSDHPQLSLFGSNDDSAQR